MCLYYIAKQINFIVVHVLTLNIITYYVLPGPCKLLIFFVLMYHLCPEQASDRLQSKD